MEGVVYGHAAVVCKPGFLERPGSPSDRKSTRLNSSHRDISYAVFCLKKKKCRSCHGRIHESNLEAAPGRRNPLRARPDLWSATEERLYRGSVSRIAHPGHRKS